MKYPPSYATNKTATEARAQQLKGEIKTHLIDDAIDALGGVYPGLDIGVDLGLLCVSLQSGSGYGTSSSTSMPLDGIICTRAEFESRKAERQNKPDWKDAPEWANWLAQDDSGQWRFQSHKLIRPGKSVRSTTGEVIGNWQDTLEQRSAISSEPVIDEIAEAKRAFAKLSTGLQDLYQEAFGKAIANMKKPEPDGAAWYDYAGQCMLKNALPASGEVCECFDYERNEFVKVKVLDAATGSREAAVATINGDSFGYVYWGCNFRPLDWSRNQQPKPESRPELSFHLATAENELQASAKLLTPESHLLQSITGVIGAIQAIREAV